ncbi:MAG: apolipoprotein N-acyltransferase [Gammaproteobacteria bacterium]|nr:MAG: apolipoprotein N-acyltransferase [Gammaproteobacteria bacterium]
MRMTYRLFLPLMAGAGMSLSFAPYGYDLLVFPCLAILFLCWFCCSPAQAFWAGWWFGVGQFGTGVSWIYISIHDFGGTDSLSAGIMTLLFVMFMALFPGLCGGLTGLMRRRFGLEDFRLSGLLIPALWVCIEWVRSWFLSGFPWLSVGYSQSDSLLAGFAPLGGVYLVSWIVAMISGLLAMAIWTLKNDRRSSIKWIFLGVLAWPVGGILKNVNWTHDIQPVVRVSMVQGNIRQDQKWLSSMKWPTIERYFGLSEKVAEQSDLIIWPETAMPVMYDQARELLSWFQQKVINNQAALLTGVPMVNERDGLIYNSMVLLRNGQQQFYFKHHLVPFGEYLPWRSLLGWAAEFFPLPEDDFSAGSSHPAPLWLDKIGLSLSICYEDAFGHEMLPQSRQSNILVNASNDAWFGHSIAAFQHLQMARMRAIEMDRPMLRVTNTGITAFVDHRGRIMRQAEQFQPQVLTESIQPRAGMTPYMIVGNAGIMSWLSFLVVLAIIFRRGERKRLHDRKGRVEYDPVP